MPLAEDTVIQPKLRVQKIEKSDKIFDLIIIGGGPAGLAAGIYGGRSMLDLLIIESSILGGQVASIDFVENYPGFPEGISGMDLCKSMEDHAANMGANFVYGTASKVSAQGKMIAVNVDEKVYKTKSLIVSSGAKPKKLNIPGEETFRGKGVSYCAVCDGSFYRDKKIIVAGGGNTAVQEAIYLTRFASSVSIVHRRDRLRADKILIERAKLDPKIFFVWNSVLTEILGDEKVRNVVIKDVKTAEITKIDAEGVFVYIGASPETGFIKDLIKIDESGYIITDENMKTSVDGIYAAGDVRKKELDQIVTAMSDGAVAAMSAVKYLENK